MHGVPRRELQNFIGGSKWSWEPLLDRMREEIISEIGSEDGTLVFDGSATPKKGEATVGVARQWCGCRGKQDNCVVGVYAAYVGRDDAAALVAAELFLPRAWADDRGRRANVDVPSDVVYRSQPRIALEMLKHLAAKMPFQWALGDDEFGRSRALRDELRALSKHYIVDVPKNTIVRRVRKGMDNILERKRWQIQEIRRRIPVADWSYFRVRDGEKGPVEVRATMLSVATERTRQPWVRETLVIIETLDGKDRWYCLASASKDTSLAEFVRRAGLRHRIEEAFGEAKGEVGLDHFETRTWQGWHHHMTLCLMSHWFLLREKRRLGKKGAWAHHQHGSSGDRSALLSADAGATCSLRELPSQAQ
jgi:SRSO17 transposase